MDTHVNLYIGVRGQRVNHGMCPRCICHHMDQLRAAFAHVASYGKYGMRLQMAWCVTPPTRGLLPAYVS